MHSLILRALQAKLETIPELNYIDYDTGQFAESNSNQESNVPAALINIAQVWNYTTIGKKAQRISGSFRLSVISSRDGSVTNHLLQSDEHYALVEKIYKALQNYSATLKSLPEFANLPDEENNIIFNSLDRTQQVQVENLAPLHRTEITFSFRSIDWSATPEYRRIATQIILNAQLRN